MLVTNSELNCSGKDVKGKKLSLLDKIAQACSNGFHKLIAAEIDNDRDVFRHIELSMCVKESINKGLSGHPRL